VEVILSNKLDDFVDKNIGTFFSNIIGGGFGFLFSTSVDSASLASETSAKALKRFVFMGVSIAARLALPRIIFR